MNLDKYKELSNIFSCYFNQDYAYDKFDYAVYDIILDDTNKESLEKIIDQINNLMAETETEENLEKVLTIYFYLDIFPNEKDITTYTELLKRICDIMSNYLKNGINDPNYFFDKVKFKYIENIYFAHFSKNTEIKNKNIDQIIDKINTKFSIDELNLIVEEINFLEKITKTNDKLEEFLKTKINFDINPQDWGDFNSKKELLNYISNRIYKYTFDFHMNRINNHGRFEY
ncbi:MAG: hypothetical protein K2X69_12440 [Silvanigrellaceae bacterium]|nr:hypothetical protein [Silvanigrellaceae bacterium]